MPLTLTTAQRAALVAALVATRVHSRTVRHWQRYQAVLLWADGVPVASVARDATPSRSGCHLPMPPGRSPPSCGLRLLPDAPPRARVVTPPLEGRIHRMLLLLSQRHGYCSRYTRD